MVSIEKLGTICVLTVGGDVPKNNYSKEKTEENVIPILSNGIGENAYYGYTNKAKITEKCVTISARGTIGYSELRKEPFYPIVRLICAIPKSDILPEYLCYYLQTMEFNVPITGIPQLTVPMIKDCEIVFPSLEKQRKIVAILDRFSSLAESMEVGIPAEIKANRQRYEYYRDEIFESLKECA